MCGMIQRRTMLVGHVKLKKGTVIQTAIPVGRLGNKTLLIFYEDSLLYKKCEKRVSIV